MRQKVQVERDKQLGLCEERVNAKAQQWQVRRLKALESEYESSLKNVGRGHAQAASQVILVHLVVVSHVFYSIMPP